MKTGTMKIKTGVIQMLLAGILILIISSCGKDQRRIKGSGPVITKTISLEQISGVSLSIDANVWVTPGDTQSVVIEAQNNIIQNIEKYVTSDGVWRIGFYDPVRKHDGITIYITTPHFDYAVISGSGSIRTDDLFAENSDVYLKISGSGNIVMHTSADHVDSEISGSGNITLNGSAGHHEINISGSGKVNAFGLETGRTDCRISGSGNCEVWANDYLGVTISGSGSVFYKGSPEIHTNISGSGGIHNVNN